MFVHINPELNSIGETISTLKFAERVASIELGAARSNKETGEIRELKEEVQFSSRICTFFSRLILILVEIHCDHFSLSRYQTSKRHWRGRKLKSSKSKVAVLEAQLNLKEQEQFLLSVCQDMVQMPTSNLRHLKGQMMTLKAQR